MRATRRSQPYRKGARQKGGALDAMLRGAPAGLPNPQDTQRAAQRLAKGRKLAGKGLLSERPIGKRRRRPRKGSLAERMLGL